MKVYGRLLISWKNVFRNVFQPDNIAAGREQATAKEDRLPRRLRCVSMTKRVVFFRSPGLQARFLSSRVHDNEKKT